MKIVPLLIFALSLRALAAENGALLNVRDFGAVGDGTTLNTMAIQSTIDKAADPGGTVLVPEGVFLSGAIFLKPGVNLRLDKGAVLKGSPNVLDYPKGPTRIEGHTEPWLPALVNAEKADHLRIMGEGMLDGNGQPFWEEFWRRRKENGKTTNMDVERPRLLFIRDSKDVQISGITLHNSGFWNLHLYRCQDVVIEKVTVELTGGRGPSTDGMDIDSSQNVTIRGCVIGTNDDCIALKGSKGPFALEDKESPPVEHIRIVGCTFKGGHGAVTFGSEATVVRDVVMEDCIVDGAMPVFRIKLRPDTPQIYTDIHCRNLKGTGGGALLSVAAWTQYFDLKGQPRPSSTVSNITFSGVRGSFGLGSVAAHERATVSGIHFENVELTGKGGEFKAGAASEVAFRNVKLNGAAVTGNE